MKSIISILFLFFTLPSFTICVPPVPRNFPKEVDKLHKSARKGLKINNALKLSKDGFLGDGGTGFVYKGINLNDNATVAIKFVADNNIKQAQKEFEMYAYLNATENADAEAYGIPVVYYYGRWEGYAVTALTKCDKDLIEIGNDGGLTDPLNVMILFRDFIIQSKYMHSHGVRHDDIKPENIMVRGHKSFVIDFNRSSKMSKDSGACTVIYAAKASHYNQTRVAKSDWESFLYSMCYVLRVPLRWLHPKIRSLEQPATELYCGTFKAQTDEIRATINNSLPHGPLKDVVNEFANEVFSDDLVKFPDYNHLYEFIRGKMAQLHPIDSPLPPMFSWLDNEQIKRAIEEFQSDPQFNIKDIVEPKSLNFKKFPYPDVVRQPDAPIANQIQRLGGSNSISRKKSGRK